MSDSFYILKNIKVFSLCSSFPEQGKHYFSFAEDHNPDSYVRWKLNGDEKEIDEIFIELGAEEGETIFIHVDY